MDQKVVDSVELGGSVAAGHDLSMWGLFMQADTVVKLIMVLLLLCSIWCWAIIFEKMARMRRLNNQAVKFEEIFWSGGTLDSLYDRIGKRPSDPMASTFASGMREWRQSAEKGLTATGPMRASLQQRVERVMSVTIGREMEGAERHMSFLASVGATAPFVGLFGTVWGIIHSFTAIANTNNTSLAVVAPGIAEALFATAIGLVAAIPAVVAYNKFSNDLGRYAERLDNFSTEFNAILSRHLEQGN